MISSRTGVAPKLSCGVDGKGVEWRFDGVANLDDDVGVPFLSTEELKPVVGGPPPPPLGFSRVLGVRKVGCCCKALGLGVMGVEDCCTLIERFNLVGESRRPVGGVDCCEKETSPMR